MDEDMSMDAPPYGSLQPAFEQQPTQQVFGATTNVGDPGRKQL